jgi:chemotaxis protein CheX
MYAPARSAILSGAMDADNAVTAVGAMPAITAVPLRNVRADFVNPFLRAASEVMLSEIGEEPTRGPIRLDPSDSTGHDVTVLIGVTGQITGIVLLGFDKATACALAGCILGRPFDTFDELAASGMGELGNVIVGRATTLLAEAGYTSTVTPPTLIVGSGTRLSTLSYQRLVIPLATSLGDFKIEVALKVK